MKREITALNRQGRGVGKGGKEGRDTYCTNDELNDDDDDRRTLLCFALAVGMGLCGLVLKYNRGSASAPMLP
jgi:hypothetical protein